MNFIKSLLFVGLCNFNLNIVCMQDYEPAQQAEQKEQVERHVSLEKWGLCCICCTLTKQKEEKLKIGATPCCLNTLDSCGKFFRGCYEGVASECRHRERCIKDRDGSYTRIKEESSCFATPSIDNCCEPIFCIIRSESGDYDFISLCCCIKSTNNSKNIKFTCLGCCNCNLNR